MKLLLSILFPLCYLLTNAQKINKTRIDTAGVVNIKGGKITILKADTVSIGTLIVNQTKRTDVYFAGYTRKRDTLGIYTTSYKFAVLDNPGSFNFDILFSFNKPFLKPSPMPDIIETNNGICLGCLCEWNDSIFTILHVKGLVQGNEFKITIGSKEPLFANIQGANERIN